jgi:hypothetical protein
MQLNSNSQKSNVLSKLHTGYAEPKESAPKVAIIDDFFGEPSGFPHGQAVESVLMSHSNLTGSDIQRIQNAPDQQDYGTLTKDGKMGFLQAFQTVAIKNTAYFYLSTATNLSTIIREQPTVKLVTQSQGESPSRLVGALYDRLEQNQQFREGVCASIGMEQGTPTPKVCQELLKIAENTIAGNEICKQARQEYLKAAESAMNHGVTYLVAAGNEGNFQQQLLQTGADPSPSSFRNIFVNEFATIVGSVDTKGQPSVFNTPNTSIDVFALGEDLAWKAEEPGFNQTGVSSGTSFAVPVVAAQALQLLEGEPDMQPFDLKAKLMGVDSTRVNAGESKTTSQGRVLAGDGKLEGFVQEAIGAGFYNDITNEEATQLAQSKQERTLFALPGEKDSDFQFVKINPNPQGVRQLEIETYYLEGHHTMRALEKDGHWDPSTVQEELHIDPKRKEQYQG